MMEYLIRNSLFFWLGAAPGILFDKGIETKEWWIFVSISIICIKLKRTLDED